MQEIEINDLNVENKKRDCSVSVIEKSETDYSAFFHNFMAQNLPCIIKNVSSGWDCTTNWIVNNTVNTDFFIEKYGDLTAPVANCDEILFNAQSKTEMTVCDYMKYLADKTKREKLLYLKDWHLQKLKPDDGFYKVPLFFASDWLNEMALDCNDDDFMFVYIGPEGSWTPLHADVYHSFSWSVNIVGRKKWTLFPPGEEEKLKDPLGNLPLLYDPEKFTGIIHFEIIQEKGDAIFVPSGWHHQVVNMADTISINHNWVNACNVQIVWIALQNNLLKVEDEIREFENSSEYPSQCQLILKALFGMDFLGFVDFVCHITRKRILQSSGQHETLFRTFILGYNHIKYDMKVLKQVLNSVTNHPLMINKHLPPQVENDLVNLTETLSRIT